jgi:hypothetical protein
MVAGTSARRRERKENDYMTYYHPSPRPPFCPPRDLIAGIVVHAVIEKELAIDGRRLEDLDAGEYFVRYSRAEAEVYGNPMSTSRVMRLSRWYGPRR